mgnify:FL=1
MNFLYVYLGVKASTAVAVHVKESLDRMYILLFVLLALV